MRKVYKAPWSWACVPTAERRMKKNPGHPAENPLPPASSRTRRGRPRHSERGLPWEVRVTRSVRGTASDQKPSVLKRLHLAGDSSTLRCTQGLWRRKRPARWKRSSFQLENMGFCIGNAHVWLKNKQTKKTKGRKRVCRAVICLQLPFSEATSARFLTLSTPTFPSSQALEKP